MKKITIACITLVLLIAAFLVLQVGFDCSSLVDNPATATCVLGQGLVTLTFTQMKQATDYALAAIFLNVVAIGILFVRKNE